jgi:hypothetical protein
VRLVDLLRERAANLGARGVCQSGQLGQMFIDLMPRGRSLARCANQQRTFLWRRQCD